MVGAKTVPGGTLTLVERTEFTALSESSVPTSQRSEPPAGRTKTLASASPAAGRTHSAEKVTRSTVPMVLGVGVALAASSQFRIVAPGPAGPVSPLGPVSPF